MLAEHRQAVEEWAGMLPNMDLVDAPMDLERGWLDSRQGSAVSCWDTGR